MSAMQFVFERYEKKYIITKEQYEIVKEKFREYMTDDEYGSYTICNIYFDNDNFDLIRTSIEKPPYKEKFRIRSYGVPGKDDLIFAEIKKKSGGIVYKRRIVDTIENIKTVLSGKHTDTSDYQVQREIMWFMDYYHPKPQVFIGYDREALMGIEDPNLRVTFDTNIRWRDKDLSLQLGDYGDKVLDNDEVVMEIKVKEAMPLWMVKILSELKIYPTGFSKYGECYKRNLKEFYRKRG